MRNIQFRPKSSLGLRTKWAFHEKLFKHLYKPDVLI